MLSNDAQILGADQYSRKVRLMPTKSPFIHVPVDELQVILGPGRKQLEQVEDTYSSDQAVEVTFRLQTTASKLPFKRKVKVWDTYFSSGDFDIDVEASLHGHEVEMNEVSFKCLIDGWQFSGTYDVKTRTGKLVSNVWDVFDPADPRNQE